uniref:Uncharacterized protein n=1 Tax=Cyclophora tenuis TaxID=216820 RepID=A0A7S1GJK4_CYCTE
MDSYNKKVAKSDADLDHNAFDRMGIYLLRNSIATRSSESSTLRKGSFDLLLLMATQESIHRVLRDYVDAGTKREVSFNWFRDYYVERAAKTFDGSQEYGRADDFMEELLLTPPSTVTEGLRMELIDPLRIAEDILEKRSEVLTEWKETVSMASEEHIELRRHLLAKQMSKWGSSSPLDAAIVQEEEQVSIELPYGEFQ